MAGDRSKTYRDEPAGGAQGGRARFGPGFDALLAAAQTGAPWALERLYCVMAPGVAAYLRVQGASDPDDLTNEVFLGLLTRIGGFSGNEDKFRSWVFTVAHSRLIDDRRQAGRRPRAVATDAAVYDVVGGDAEDDAMRNLSDERVRRLCEQLPSDQRDVLLLRLMAGLTLDAVAQALGKSETGVKALQRRGLANLRKILRPQPVSK